MKLLLLAVAFVAGVFFGAETQLHGAGLLMLACSASAGAVLLKVRGRPYLPAILIVAALVGAARGVAFDPDGAAPLSEYHSIEDISVAGWVADDPEPAGRAVRFRFRVEEVSGSIEGGDVLVTMASADVRYGDRLLLSGVLEEPPAFEDFDYAAFLARRGIGSVMSFPEGQMLDGKGGSPLSRVLTGLRLRLAESTERVVPEPQAAFGQAVLLGIRDHLPPRLVDDFRATGASHLLAISGLHVGILLGLSLTVSQWLLGRRRNLYLLAPLLLLWLYAAVAGMSPSVTRAAIMASVYVAAMALGRPRAILPSLGLAAAAMVAFDPKALWSVSFQLSFAAMAGIAVLAEPMGRLLSKAMGAPADGADESSLRRSLTTAAAMGAAATLATWPLVAFYFERVSFIGLPVTMLALPALPVVLLAHAATGALGLVATWLAAPFGWAAWASGSYVTGLVGLAARLPVADAEVGRMAPVLLWGYYALLAGAALGQRRLGSLSRLTAAAIPRLGWGRLTAGQAPLWLVAPVVAAAALAWLAVLSLPDGRLHVTFADVGQGDAAFIVTPGGAQIMMDGGADPDEAVRVASSKMPFWDRTIDLVILTHPHHDHVAGLTEVLRRYRVLHVLERRLEYDGAAYRDWREAVAAEGATVTQAAAGQTISFSDGTVLEVVNPPERLVGAALADVNNSSVAVRLAYGSVSFMLTGDMYVDAEARLLSSGLRVDSDVLKVAHHGSRTSSSEEFLSRVSPVAAVVSVGEGNRYGHPNPDVMLALQSLVPAGQVFLTSEHGSVEFTYDGARLRVKTEK